jgi:Spy/CpxP family protein refolding chaperone
MKKMMLTAVLLASMTAVSAQEKSNPKPEQKAPSIAVAGSEGRRPNKLNEMLRITPEQQTKVDEIAKEYGKAMTDLKSTGLKESDMELRAMELRKARDSKMEQVLEKEQYLKLESLRKEMGDRDAMPITK